MRRRKKYQARKILRDSLAAYSLPIAPPCLGLVLTTGTGGGAMTFPHWPFILAAMVVSFAIGWQLEDCWHVLDSQPVIMPERLP